MENRASSGYGIAGNSDFDCSGHRRKFPRRNDPRRSSSMTRTMARNPTTDNPGKCDEGPHGAALIFSRRRGRISADLSGIIALNQNNSHPLTSTLAFLAEGSHKGPLPTPGSGLASTRLN